MGQIEQYMIDTIRQAMRNNEKFDKTKLKAYNEYYKKTYLERLQSIIDEAVKDGKDADILKGLEQEKPVLHSLVKQSFQISLQYGCCKYAEEIILKS